MLKGLFSRAAGFAWSEIIALLLIIIYPLFFLRQGLDFTDTGFLLTNFQQMFIEPSSVESSFKLWLTNVLGGIWIYFFGDSLGLLGYKVTAVLLAYVIALICFLILKNFFPTRHILWGLLFTVIFVNRSGFQFSYNSLTSFFYVLSAYFLVRGLLNDQNRLIAAGAFVLGLNIFIRLPNILGFVLILTVFFAGYVNKTRAAQQVKQALYFMTGYLAAVVLILLIIYFWGQLNSYLHTMLGTYAMLGDPRGHHSGIRLLEVVLKLYKMTWSMTVFLGLGLAGLIALLLVSGRLKQMIIQYTLIICSAGAWLYFYHDFWQDWYALIGLMHGIILLTLVFTLVNKREDCKKQRVIGFVALLILLVVPIGSANGFVNAVFGMHLAIPFVFGIIFSIGHLKELRLIKLLFLGIFAFMIMNSAWHFTYRDSAQRNEMVFSVEHPKLKGMLTTADRAEVVQELLDVLPDYAAEGDYLLAYEQISLVYFLTKTKPYMYGSWPMLFDPAKFRYYLNKAEQERPNLPVIVRAKGSTEDPAWPHTAGLRKNNDYLLNDRAIVSDFISSKCYNVVWENSFFQILVPENEMEK